MRWSVPLGIRIFLVYGLFVALAGYFVLQTVMDEVKPGVRESAEETLVDTANLLAELLADDMRRGTLQQSRFSEYLRAYGERRPQARIWGIEKSGVSQRIYVTDRAGIVLLDSTGTAVGQDYSRWNDVYRTLRGQYGARTTRDDPDDELSSVMYVAAPIRDGTDIIGVVTVAKPNRTVQPYIERSERRLAWIGAGIIGLGLTIGAIFSWWLSGTTRGLTRYANAVSAGERAAAPASLGGEFGELARALESMRTQLEGKAYVERYVQTLTHELKSPLAAIRGASEVLRSELAAPERDRFLDNIDSESQRMQQLVDRLLHLALVEQRRGLEEVTVIPLRALAEELVAAQAGRIERAGIRVQVAIAPDVNTRGERFLVRQALANLLDNALDFTPAAGAVRIDAAVRGTQVALIVDNQGEPIPQFALARLTERFYSLPRPGSGRKSTGLGLNFVQEVALLHGGRLDVANVERGVRAELTLPRA